MSDTNDGDIKKKRRANAPELKLAGIDYNVGPDAEARLSASRGKIHPQRIEEMSRGVENERE